MILHETAYAEGVLTRVVGFVAGIVMGALPLMLLLFLRGAASIWPATVVAFVVATLVTLHAHRSAAWWLAGAVVSFVTTPAIIGFEWLAAVYVLLIPAVMLPVLAGAAAGIVASHTLDAWGNQKSEI